MWDGYWSVINRKAQACTSHLQDYGLLLEPDREHRRHEVASRYGCTTDEKPAAGELTFLEPNDDSNSKCKDSEDRGVETKDAQGLTDLPFRKHRWIGTGAERLQL